MRAMILAAGRGQRMRPLTDTCPKPLLQAGGKALIVWHLQRLAQAGIKEIIINHAWLGFQIEAALGNGQDLGVHLSYSPESPALETAGGIARALAFFNQDLFLLVNGDIWCDWDPASALTVAARWHPQQLGHLVLVDNPAHHPAGDFILRPDGLVQASKTGAGTLTYAGIGVFHPHLFASTDPNKPAALAPLLHQAMAQGAIRGEHHPGAWVDVGTPERLAKLDQQLQMASHRPTQAS